ncbi:MAG: SAM-dependent methyltransferase [Magnetococcales bacterium]|nr:SAM-dependent methyltransferase [Magnetococcales bacterium]
MPGLETTDDRLKKLNALLRSETDSVGGALSFRDFMDHALYHPALGYYMVPSERVGRAGDFVTAPEMTSLFGELLTLQWVELWQTMGKPDRFDVVEAGAGSGRLAVDILNTAAKFQDFSQALHYAIIEISPDFQTRQSARIGQECHPVHPVHWHHDLDALERSGGVRGVLFSNELLDAMPVHWVEMRQDGLVELGVFWGMDDEGTARWLARPLNCPESAVINHFSGRGITLEVGAQAEVSLDAQAWWSKAATLVHKGLLLAIDYGDVAAALFGIVRGSGTLVGHLNHQRVDDPLLHPGEMDLTAHVDFSGVATAGERAGLETVGYTTQAWFLMGLGILERVEMALAAMSENPVAADGLKRTLSRLIMPDGMGDRFKVLAQSRGMGRFIPAGFRLNDQRPSLFGTV